MRFPGQIRFPRPDAGADRKLLHELESRRRPGRLELLADWGLGIASAIAPGVILRVADPSWHEKIGVWLLAIVPPMTVLWAAFRFHGEAVRLSDRVRRENLRLTELNARTILHASMRGRGVRLFSPIWLGGPVHAVIAAFFSLLPVVAESHSVIRFFLFGTIPILTYWSCMILIGLTLWLIMVEDICRRTSPWRKAGRSALFCFDLILSPLIFFVAMLPALGEGNGACFMMMILPLCLFSVNASVYFLKERWREVLRAYFEFENEG